MRGPERGDIDSEAAQTRTFPRTTHDVRLCLIVEDEPTSARLARAAIDALDAFSLNVHSLAEASRALEEWPIDLAIVDLGLPDGSGLDFVRELRDICTCPILVCTGSADRQTVMEAASAGANDYALKPVDVRSLSERVRTMVGRVPARWEPWTDVASRTGMSRAEYEGAVETYAADLHDLAARFGREEGVDESLLESVVSRAADLGHLSLAPDLERERAHPSSGGVPSRLLRAARSAELMLKSHRQGAGPLAWRPDPAGASAGDR
jgi:DNA-binding response OmpR family regulator